MEELGAPSPAESHYDLVRPYIIGVVADLPRSTSDGWYVPAGRIIAPVLDEQPAYMTDSGQPPVTKRPVHHRLVAIAVAAAFFALISLAFLGGSRHGPAVLAAKCGSSGCQLAAPQSPITVFQATINSGHRPHSSSARSAMQADNMSQGAAVTAPASSTTPSTSLTRSGSGSGSPPVTTQSCGPMTSQWFVSQPWGNTCHPQGSGMPRHNRRGPAGAGPGSSAPRGTGAQR
jgi:hypothetical protein